MESLEIRGWFSKEQIADLREKFDRLNVGTYYAERVTLLPETENDERQP